MTRIKICGIQRPDHAVAAAEAEADFIGLVFVPGRRRCLTIDAARDIVSRLRSSGGDAPQVVGLFADQPLEEVVRIIQLCDLDLVQLCGQESIDYCGQVPVPVIKVLHVPNPPNPPLLKGGRERVSHYEIETDQAEVPPSGQGGPGGISTPTGQPGIDFPDVDRLAQLVQSYRKAGHLVTLDRLVDGLPGGTGQSFDWEIAGRLSRQGHSFLLAGGLTPDNVARAISRVQPWGVDVSSGVETGGAKDPEQIRAFIRNVRNMSLD